MSGKNKSALIVGGTGITGRSVIESLERRSDWNITALSRRKPDFETKAEFISVDLLDDKDSEKKLSELSGITHFFYCGLSGGIEAENVEGNLKLLTNSLGNCNKIFNADIKFLGIFFAKFNRTEKIYQEAYSFLKDEIGTHLIEQTVSKSTKIDIS